MATNTGNIAIGAAQVSIGAYAAAGAASGSLVDVGHTKGPTTMSASFNDYEIVTEQTFGPVRKIPISASIKVKVMMDEATADNMRIAMRQLAANVTGTAPNKTHLVGNISEQYHQIVIVAKGPGATTPSTRTITLWRAIVESIEEISYGKSPEQTLAVTFALMYDDTVATADKFFKVVDSGGA